MGILSDSQILKAIEKKDIVIRPFEPNSLGSNSYDLRLSNKLKVYSAFNKKIEIGNATAAVVRDPITNSHDLFIDFEPKPFLDFKNSEEQTTDIIIPEEGLILEPGMLYLGSTKEYTETHKLVPFIEGKSSVGRLGVKVHITAGRGDAGFCGHWTLEIEVVHRVKVYPGMKIAQIFYFDTGFVVNPYNKKDSAKYNNHTQIPMPSKYYENFDEKKDLKKEIENINPTRNRFIDSGIPGLPKDEE